MTLTCRHPNQSEEAFNKWYDEVHAPSRARCPGVNSVSRYAAADNKQPEWLAIYELSDESALQTPEYKKARENDGDDESTMFAYLDRRVYKLYSDKRRDDYDAYSRSGKPRGMIHVAANPSKTTDVTDEEFHKFYEEEHVPMLTVCPGWLRSVRLVLVDSRDPRDGMESEGNTANLARFLAFHEFEDLDKYYASKEHNDAVTTPWRMRVMSNLDEKTEERRLFKLWKQF